jgi:hypothetical protein
VMTFDDLDYSQVERFFLTSDEKLDLWGYGEWVEEIDYKSFSHKAFDCIIYRHWLGSGYFSGYVRIPPYHCWFEKRFYEIDARVHGGLSFSVKSPSSYWLGFDCAGCDDIQPGIADMQREYIARFENKLYPGLTYKNIDFVKKELMDLVDQGIEASKA